ncbi:MAG TPA: IS200/IS605 family transposase [Chryseolinea sp.]|jgi:REP element-mobilizing transposase RayT|nr:IS200/IS605 family transposase [Chryseolinea sp.]
MPENILQMLTSFPPESLTPTIPAVANTYTQIHIHAIFAVRNRACLIQPEWKEELYKYISGIAQTNNKHKLIIINGMPDHVHLFIGMRPNQSLSDLMQDIKGSSSKWINGRKFLRGRFEWQEGYGAFSYGKSQIGDVIAYIRDQEIHHQNFNFLDEYKMFLEKFNIDYDSRYIFNPIQ